MSRQRKVVAVSTLSRNFQMQFLGPILAVGEVDFALQSGRKEELLAALHALALDVVLTTEPAKAGGLDQLAMQCILVAEQAVAAHGHPARLGQATLSEMLSQEPIIVIAPTESAIHAGFDALVKRLNVRPRIVAEVDDMAMVCLLARNNVGVAIPPAVVLDSELQTGLVQTAAFELDISEMFYAVTVERTLPHPALTELIS